MPPMSKWPVARQRASPHWWSAAEREEHESLLEVYLRAIKGARVSKAA